VPQTHPAEPMSPRPLPGAAPRDPMPVGLGAVPGTGVDRDALPAASFLGRLDADAFAALCALGSLQSYPAGRSVLNQGDPSSHLLAVLHGRVHLVARLEDGGEMVLAIRGPGDLTGELSALDGQPRTAGAVAVERVEAVALRADVFNDFLTAYPQATRMLLGAVVARLRDADRRRMDLGGLDVLRRVAGQLLELGERYGRTEPGSRRLELRLSQRELAGLVGSSREAVARALAGLRDRGAVETRHRTIAVVDADHLRRLCPPSRIRGVPSVF
jgi:CRP/FNR family cyclic AMP-dependent transcriptional regulator